MTETTETVTKPVLDIHERPSFNKWIILSIQHLFTMFGSTIFVPSVTGLSPGVALVSSGLGTLAYLGITRGKIPAYLGSSFTFIAPITALLAAKSGGGPGAVMVGTFSVGVVYAIVSLIVYYAGVDWIQKVLPPIVVGPVIMVIGLSLAPSAAAMAMGTNNGKYRNFVRLHSRLLNKYGFWDGRLHVNQKCLFLPNSRFQHSICKYRPSNYRDGHSKYGATCVCHNGGTYGASITT